MGGPAIVFLQDGRGWLGFKVRIPFSEVAESLVERSKGFDVDGLAEDGLLFTVFFVSLRVFAEIGVELIVQFPHGS